MVFLWRLKNPGCVVCTFCVLHCAPQKLTLSQFFPLPSSAWLQESAWERCHLSSQTQNQPEGEEQTKSCLRAFPASSKTLSYVENGKDFFCHYTPPGCGSTRPANRIKAVRNGCGARLTDMQRKKILTISSLLYVEVVMLSFLIYFFLCPQFFTGKLKKMHHPIFTTFRHIISVLFLRFLKDCLIVSFSPPLLSSLASLAPH